MTAIVTQGDAAHLHLPDASVDLICTSPPYFNLRAYQDGGEVYDGQIGADASPTAYLDRLIACTAEWMRVLKPGGSIFVNLGDKYAQARGHGHWESRNGKGDQRGQKVAGFWRDKGAEDFGYKPKSLMMLPQRYAIRCIDELDLILRAEIIWSKPNGLPESVTDRVRRSHEQVFHFVKQPRYYAAVDEIREPHLMKPQRRTPRRVDTTPRQGPPRQSWPLAGRDVPGVDGHPLGKLPGSVWSIPTSPLRVPAELGIDHFAAYPPDLVRRIVLGWSPAGGVVLDPFAGTGTTMLVASVHGRVGIGVDLSADYCRLAQWRTQNDKQRAKAAGVKPKPARKPKAESQLAQVTELPTTPGQIDLFGEQVS